MGNRLSLRKTGFLLFLIFCLSSAAALGEIKVNIEPAEWTWEEKANSTFRGTIFTDGQEMQNVRLNLKIDTRLEDSGIIQFTHINGKKLKIRKRGPEVETDLSGAPEGNSFEAEWLVPASTQGGVAHAVVTLSVLDQAGGLIQTGMMEMGSETSEDAIVSASPLARLKRLISYLSVGCGVVWLLAISRYLVLNQRKKRG